MAKLAKSARTALEVRLRNRVITHIFSRDPSHQALRFTGDERQKLQTMLDVRQYQPSPETPLQALAELVLNKAGDQPRDSTASSTPARLKEAGAIASSSMNLPEVSSWYGGRALHAILVRKGVVTPSQQDEVMEFARLISYRPLGLLDHFIEQLCRAGSSHKSLDLGTLAETIELTEKWADRISSFSFYQSLLTLPITDQEFSTALRELGAQYDEEPVIRWLLAVNDSTAPELLIPGSSTYLDILNTPSFIQDMEGESGIKRFVGLQDFKELVVSCQAKRDPELLQIFGRLVDDAFDKFITSARGTTYMSSATKDRIVRQLVGLSDGLLRLVNRELGGFTEAIKDISPGRGIGKLLAHFGSNHRDQYDFLSSHRLELGLLSHDPLAIESLGPILRETTQYRREELFDLYTTAPGLLEAHQTLKKLGRSHPACIGVISHLVVPLSARADSKTIAQTICDLASRKNNAVINAIFDNLAWVAASINDPSKTDILADLLAALELVDRPTKLLHTCKKLLDDGDLAGARAAIESQFASPEGQVGATTHPQLAPTANASPVSESPPAADLQLPGWCRWLGRFIPDTPQVHARLTEDVRAHGQKPWFKKMIFDPEA